MKTVMLIIIAVSLGTLSPLNVKSQNPVDWNFTAKKIDDKTYEIHLTPTVQNSWHIYSQNSPEGGAQPTKISFNKNPLIKLEGMATELGKIVNKYEDVFNVTVKYFEGEIDFVQIVKLKVNVKTNLIGNVEFMACNNKQCLPPKSIDFSIPLR